MNKKLNQKQRLTQQIFSPTTVGLRSKMFPIKITPYYRDERCSIDMIDLCVAARLRSLRSDDPLSKGHPRSIKQGLQL